MTLLKWAFIALVVAAVAALLGFTGIAEGFADVAKVLFGIFVVFFLMLVALGITIFKGVT